MSDTPNKSMQTNDTPRTDRARGFHDMDTAVDAEEMEKLERELAEAGVGLTKIYVLKQNAEKERDELRAKVAELDARHSVQRMVRAIRDLLDHPFPHDLMKLRRRVASEYGGDEAAAKAEMEEWCSQELCDRELDAYIEARKSGNAIIAEYGPNASDDQLHAAIAAAMNPAAPAPDKEDSR